MSEKKKLNRFGFNNGWLAADALRAEHIHRTLPGYVPSPYDKPLMDCGKLVAYAHQLLQEPSRPDAATAHPSAEKTASPHPSE